MKSYVADVSMDKWKNVLSYFTHCSVSLKSHKQISNSLTLSLNKHKDAWNMWFSWKSMELIISNEPMKECVLIFSSLLNNFKNR